MNPPTDRVTSDASRLRGELAAAIEQVKLILARLAPEQHPRTSAAAPGALASTPASPSGGDSSSNDDRNPVSGMSADTPLRQLQQRFGLNDFECNVLLLCAAAEFDTQAASLIARAQADPGRRQATFGLALALFEPADWSALASSAPLQRWLLVDAHQPGATPLSEAALRLDEQILQFMAGHGSDDARLAPYFSPFLAEADPAALSASQRAQAEHIFQCISRAAAAGEATPAIVLLGNSPLAKQMTARAVVQAAGGAVPKLVRIPLQGAPTEAREAEQWSRLWAREARLFGLAYFLDADEVEHAGRLPLLRRFAADESVVCFIASREPVLSLPRRDLTLEVRRPTPEEQEATWSSALEAFGVGDAVPTQLANHFDFDLPIIHATAARAAEESSHGSDSETRNAFLRDLCSARHRPALDGMAQRIVPRAEQEDLVLPPAETAMIEDLMAQVEHRNWVYRRWGFEKKMSRGLGISALFAGESGTGKTLAAEVIARRLGLDLYRVDLSAVVDKYIGETEKNLRRVFDAADEGGVVLFFDEADALFGKRSEVKDSHDRYANIQIDYLLQRLETYRGLVILATNLRRAMDAAFTRRLRFIIKFAPPGPTERRRIWERIYPDAVPAQNLNFAALAQHNLTGGEIRNIALHAAFLAAQAGGGVTMELLHRAIHLELIKLGRPVHATLHFQAA